MGIEMLDKIAGQAMPHILWFIVFILLYTVFAWLAAALFLGRQQGYGLFPHKNSGLVFFVGKFRYNARRFVAVTNCAIVAAPRQKYKLGLYYEQTKWGHGICVLT
jgi:hypothetical protein